MARLNKQDLVIKGNQYFKYIYKVEAVYFSGKRSLYYTKLDDVKRYVNKYVGKNDDLYLVNIHRYDVKSVMSEYIAEYKQYNLAYLLFIADRDNVFTFVTGWNMQGWINGGLADLEEQKEIEQQAKEEQKEIEQQAKEEQKEIEQQEKEERMAREKAERVWHQLSKPDIDCFDTDITNGTVLQTVYYLIIDGIDLPGVYHDLNNAISKACIHEKSIIKYYRLSSAICGTGLANFIINGDYLAGELTIQNKTIISVLSKDGDFISCINALVTAEIIAMSKEVVLQKPEKNMAIKSKDVIKDIFVVNDENIYDNINDAVNDNATDKAIDFFTLPYWTTGACVKNIDKKRWGAHCNLLVSDGELVAFELTSNNNKTRRHDITMIRQLVFYARRLKAGENIKNEINREYRERSQQND